MTYMCHCVHARLCTFPLFLYSNVTYLLYFSYANNECYPKAVEDFERALEADPKHSNARKYLLETRLAFGRRFVWC